MQEIVNRFAISTEKVREWAIQLYQARARRREYKLYFTECNSCNVYQDNHGAIYEKYNDGSYGVADKELAEQGFITALKYELEHCQDNEQIRIRIGVWYTNYGIAAWQASDHIHIVPPVMEKLILGTLSPREEDKPVDVPVSELPRKLRMLT